MQPLLPLHYLHGDERYYIGRALQDIEFYIGVRPAKDVWFSAGNHPFSAETIIGLSIVLQGEFRKAPQNPWRTHVDRGLLVAARRSALLVGLVGLGALLFLAIYLDPWLAPIPILYLLASPGFVDFSMRCMLDIYLASFTTLTLVCISLYVLTGSRKWLLASGVFEGLALGSKTGWDPLVAFLVCSIAILVTETRFKAFIKRWILYTILAFVSFGSTSTVILLRLQQHINSVLRYHATRIELANMLTNQPLIGTSVRELARGYSIFAYQHPICMLITSVSILAFIGFLVYAAVKHRSLPSKSFGKASNDRLLKVVLLAVAFMALTLLLTSMTFEYGRNYARLTLYECLVTVLCLAYLLRGRSTLVKLSSISIVSALLALALHSYWCNVFGTCYYSGKGFFFRSGWALAAPWLWMGGREPLSYLIPPAKLVNLIPWTSWLLLLSALASLALLAIIGATIGIQRIPIAIQSTTNILRNIHAQLRSLSARASKKVIAIRRPRPTTRTEETIETKAPEASEKAEETEAHGETPQPSLSDIASTLLEELGEAPTDDAIARAFIKIAGALKSSKD